MDFETSTSQYKQAEMYPRIKGFLDGDEKNVHGVLVKLAGSEAEEDGMKGLKYMEEEFSHP